MNHFLHFPTKSVQQLVVSNVTKDNTLTKIADFHKSTLDPIPVRGIACNSDLIHRNSPITQVTAAHAMFKLHHENVVGNVPLYIQQAIKCKPWNVQLETI